MPKDEDVENILPPLDRNHGFKVGDKVEFPVWGEGLMTGTIEKLDLPWGKRHLKGLAILGENGRYYELHLDLTKKLEESSKKEREQ